MATKVCRPTIAIYFMDKGDTGHDDNTTHSLT